MCSLMPNPKLPVSLKFFLQQLVFLHLESAFQNFQGLFTAHSHVHGDLFVTTNPKGPQRVPGLGIHGLLSRELFEHAGRPSESVTALTDTTIENELVDPNVSHGVLLFVSHGV